MNLSDIAKLRLLNQQLIGTNFKTPKEIVAHLGAVQAQDYPMAKWAIGVRLPGSTNETIEQAIDNGEIIRTHIMRPTWHLVSSDDIRWMLKLTSPNINNGVAVMNRNLELNDNIFRQCNKVIEKSLAGGKHLTRQELMSEFQKAGIATNDLRSAHIMFRAEQDALVCNGSMRGKQLTYALLDERVPNGKTLEKDEALAKLAKRYFTSHAPATLKDFVWWSGLSVGNARVGLEAIKSDLICEEIEGQAYWLPNTFSTPPENLETVHFLPAFDEFMVSYKDRSASLNPVFAKDAITGNGIFKPIIVVNGEVIGIWKRSIKKNTVKIETQFFNSSDKFKKEIIAFTAESFGQFCGLKTEIVGG